MTSVPPKDLAGRIEDIESAYEFMLAYAAQGREGNEEGSASQIRQFLSSLDAALHGLSVTARQGLDHSGVDTDHIDAFVQLVDKDANKARAAVGIVLAQTRISSQLVDNLNASTHLRALLTDLFLLDEVLKINPQSS